jgi:hypothetical protein
MAIRLVAAIFSSNGPDAPASCRCRALLRKGWTPRATVRLQPQTTESPSKIAPACDNLLQLLLMHTNPQGNVTTFLDYTPGFNAPRD